MSLTAGAPEQATVLQRFRDGNVLGLARAITVVENERSGFQELLHTVMERGPQARRVGFTGPPGAGKSSLVAAVATEYRKLDEYLGVVAVDPTSPYSGGALLGDRIRMNDISTDPGIFIRSMATRGSLGGRATTTKEVVDLMDAFGFDRVLVETVGVGQTELEVTAAADTVVVVLVPESGDAIQAMKAGLMEIADIFVMNKADRKGANQAFAQIKSMLETRTQVQKEWTPSVVKTSALEQDGMSTLMEALSEHRNFLMVDGEISRKFKRRLEKRIRKYIDTQTLASFWDEDKLSYFKELMNSAEVNGASPLRIAQRLLQSNQEPI